MAFPTRRLVFIRLRGFYRPGRIVMEYFDFQARHLAPTRSRCRERALKRRSLGLSRLPVQRRSRLLLALMSRFQDAARIIRLLMIAAEKLTAARLKVMW